MDRQQIVWTESKLCGQTANCVDRQQIVWTELGASEWLRKRRYKLDIQHHTCVFI